MAPASAQEAGWRRSGAQLSAVLASKRGKAALVTILIATGGSYAYLQVQQAKAAKRRKRLRDSLRASSGASESAVTQRKGRGARQRVKNGQALMPTLKYLFRLAGPKILTLLALAVARTLLSNRLARLQGHLFRAAFLKRVPLFMRNLTENLALCLAASTIEATSKHCLARLEQQWQRRLTERIHHNYFENMTYYKLPFVDHSIAHPEVPICEDVPKLARGLAELLGEWLGAATDGLFYSVQLQRYSRSPRYALGIAGYVVAAGAVTTVLSPSFGRLFKREQELEGNYRNLHAKLRDNAEPVAFYGGIEREGALITASFSELIRHRVRLLRTQWRFNVVQDFFLKYLASTWAVVLIIGPFFGGHLRPEDTLQGRAAMLSNMRYHTSVIIALFSALGVLGSSGKKLMRLGAYADRIAETERAVRAIAHSTDEGGEGQIVASEDEIAFENACVVTPANATLVRELTLRVPAGTNLLVTGPNGSGKSSLFRVLGGLWPLAGGRILKPGGRGSDGLSHDIFYVPQRPYVNTGTLQEQLIYPKPAGGSDVGVAELTELLAAVDLDYLLDRHGMHATIDWGAVLSLGEQQRLGMARLFYHRPRYAILDECTSGVTVDMEERFCSRVKALGCTCITISHRPALVAFHDLVLSLDGEGGWAVYRGKRAAERDGEGDDASSYADVAMSSSAPSGEDGAKVRSQDAAAVLASMREDSMKLAAAAAGGSGELLSQSPVQRDAEMVAVGAPKLACQAPPLTLTQRWQSVLGSLFSGRTQGKQLATIAGVVLLRTLLQDRIATLNGRTVEHVLRQDRAAFMRLIGVSVLQSAASAVLAPSLKHTSESLALAWRRRLTRIAHAQYLRGNTFYSASQLAGMQDVDQRITRDVERLAGDMAALVPTMVKPVVDILWFSTRLWALTGRRGMAVLYIYAALGFGCLRAVTPDFGSLAAIQYRLEGAFRAVHTRLRTHAESVAFFGGGAAEGTTVAAAFDGLMAHLRRVSAVRWGHAVADDFFSKQLPNNVTWLLTLMYSLDQTGDPASTAVQGQLVSEMRYLASVVTQCFTAFGELLGMQKRFAELSGGVTRVSELGGTLRAAAAQEATIRNIAAADDITRDQDGTEDSIVFDGATVVTPAGKLLARQLSLVVRPQHSLLITGPNGSGKSSIFRVLHQLWPLPDGRIGRPTAADGGQAVFYVPQKPYTTTGTLREQVIYPLTVDQAASRADGQSREAALAELDERLDGLMEVVRLSYLIKREGGWGAVCEWGETLSLGEQQRLGMARLFFQRPAFGALDECTNATSADVEEALYAHARQLGITLVTVTQRTALVKYHETELRLDGEGGWQQRRLPAA